jgi:hypothetical protein
LQRRDGFRHLPACQIPHRQPDDRQHAPQGCGFEPFKARTDHQKDAAETDQDRRPPPPADCFAQHECRAHGYQERRCLQDRGQHRQRDQRQRGDKAETADDLAQVPQQHSGMKKVPGHHARPVQPCIDGENQGADKAQDREDLPHRQSRRGKLDEHVLGGETCHSEHHQNDAAHIVHENASRLTLVSIWRDDAQAPLGARGPYPV